MHKQETSGKMNIIKPKHSLQIPQGIHHLRHTTAYKELNKMQRRLNYQIQPPIRILNSGHLNIPFSLSLDRWSLETNLGTVAALIVGISLGWSNLDMDRRYDAFGREKAWGVMLKSCCSAGDQENPVGMRCRGEELDLVSSFESR